MGDLPFDRVTINGRERPLSTDINQAQSEMDRSLRHVLMQMYLGRVSDTNDAATLPVTGFIGEAFKVRPSSPLSMVVRLPKGLGFCHAPADTPTSIGGITSVNDLESWKPFLLSQDVNITLTAPSAPNNRYDLIEVNYNRVLQDNGSRDVLNLSTGKFDPILVYKTLGWDMSGSVGSVASPADSTAAISWKRGVPAVTPSVPAGTAGYTTVAVIYVAAGVTTIDADAIRDARTMLWPGGQSQVGINFNMQGAGSLKPTNLSVIAPPGVSVFTLGTSLVGQSADVYLMLGGGVTPTVNATCNSELSTYVAPVRSWLANYSFVTVNSVLQAALAGANATPTAKVAIGQRLYMMTAISLAADSGSSTVRYTIHVDMRT